MMCATAVSAVPTSENGLIFSHCRHGRGSPNRVTQQAARLLLACDGWMVGWLGGWVVGVQAL